jgi:hypothetical protein
LIFSSRQEIVAFSVTIITKQQAHIPFLSIFRGGREGVLERRGRRRQTASQRST